MIRKVLTILFTILIIPITTFAISLADLKNNPDRYKYVGETPDMAIYIDMNSVNSLRYSPPYYTLRGDSYEVYYTKNSIVRYSIIANYNYYYSYVSTSKRIIEQMNRNKETMDKNVFYKRLNDQLSNNTGMKETSIHMTIWNIQGELLYDDADNKEIVLPYRSIGYFTAEEFFHKYYNQWF